MSASARSTRRSTTSAPDGCFRSTPTERRPRALTSHVGPAGRDRRLRPGRPAAPPRPCPTASWRRTGRDRCPASSTTRYPASGPATVRPTSSSWSGRGPSGLSPTQEATRAGRTPRQPDRGPAPDRRDRRRGPTSAPSSGQHDGQRLPAPHRGGGGDASAREVDVPCREPVEQLVERDPSLQASQGGAQAEVGAEAERQVSPTRPVDVERSPCRSGARPGWPTPPGTGWRCRRARSGPGSRSSLATYRPTCGAGGSKRSSSSMALGRRASGPRRSRGAGPGGRPAPCRSSRSAGWSSRCPRRRRRRGR